MKKCTLLIHLCVLLCSAQLLGATATVRDFLNTSEESLSTGDYYRSYRTLSVLEGMKTKAFDEKAMELYLKTIYYEKIITICMPFCICSNFYFL